MTLRERVVLGDELTDDLERIPPPRQPRDLFRSELQPRDRLVVERDFSACFVRHAAEYTAAAQYGDERFAK